MQHISNIQLFKKLVPIEAPAKPKRFYKQPPPINGAYTPTLKQDFLRNPRMSSGVKVMLSLLVGLDAQEKNDITTIGAISKYIGVSYSTAQRYLKEAVELGYLFYSRTKCRMGLYTGIKLYLSFSYIKHKYDPKNGRNSARSDMNDTKVNSNIKRENTPQEQEFIDKIAAIAKRNRLEPI